MAERLRLSTIQLPGMVSKLRGQPIALSALTLATLGKPLNKIMQISDWQQRPLSASQLRYAAIDAHAGLRVFLRIWEHLSEADKALVLK